MNTPHTSATSNLRVLVVDDDADTAWTEEKLLQNFGFNVRVARDGDTALHKIKDWQPDVVLLDIGLPELNGWQVARQVREQQLAKQPFLIAVTGYAYQQHLEQSKQAGVDLHLVKPVDVNQLKDLLVSFEKLVCGAAR